MRIKLCLVGVALPLALIACDRESQDSDRAKSMEPARAMHSSSSTQGDQPGDSAVPNLPDFNETRLEAEAKFASLPKMKVTGEVDLEEVASGVRLHIDVQGVPKGKKAVHIHQKDDCSDIAGKSMGGHFAPMGAEHGFPTAGEHHLGDLGNMTVDDDGDGELEIIVAKANLKPGDPMSLLGRSVVIHEGEDDGKGKSGNSGTPIACAPIKAD